MQFDWLNFAILLFLFAGLAFGGLPVVLSLFFYPQKAKPTTYPFPMNVE